MVKCAQLVSIVVFSSISLLLFLYRLVLWSLFRHIFSALDALFPLRWPLTLLCITVLCCHCHCQSQTFSPFYSRAFGIPWWADYSVYTVHHTPRDIKLKCHPSRVMYARFNAHQQVTQLPPRLCKFSQALHLIMTYQRPQLPNYEWELPANQGTCSTASKLPNFNITPQERVHSDSFVQSFIDNWGTAGEEEKSVFLQAICGWVMARVHYRMIWRYQTLAFWIQRRRIRRREGWTEGCQGRREETSMKDDGESEGRGKDEKPQERNQEEIRVRVVVSIRDRSIWIFWGGEYSIPPKK